MKNPKKDEELRIVTKDNFQSMLKEFKDLLNSDLFEYIIINNDISSSNSKFKSKEGELIFSEFTICKKQNLGAKDINYSFVPFLIPSLKLHRYTNDEIISFSNTFLRYLTNEKYVYDFNLISSGNSLSYDNIHKKKEFENTLNHILLDGKPFKKENRKSYTYYPKALLLPSKKFRNKFEELVKYFVKQLFDDEEKINDENDRDKIFYKSDKYISDYKLLMFFLNFKWQQIFDKVDSEKYKIVINEYKIKFINKDIGDISTFLSFIQNLKQYFEDDKENTYKFELDIKDKVENALTEELLEVWKQCLMAEENVLEFSYDFHDNENKINFNIKADKEKENRKFENIKKLLDSINSIPDEIKEKDEIEIKSVYYRRINMKELFPEKIKNNIEFYYHPIAKVKEKEMKELIKGKRVEDYLKKVSFVELFLKKKNDEEILFGYRFEPQLKFLFDIERNKNISKTIPLEFGKDLDILLSDEKFLNAIKKSFSEFKLQKEDKNYNNRTINLNLNQDVEFYNEKSEILKIAKDIKKKLLIDEEIGVTYFYEAIFNKKGINIYGTNLKNKLYFPIEELLLEPGKKNEEEVKKILDNANIYDISYICYKKNVDFYKKYISIKKDEKFKEKIMTQRLGYVIEETDVLQNEDILNEMKNKFYYDLDVNKYSVKCPKEKFYDNVDDIFRIMKNKCDFIINKVNNDSSSLELSIIDKEKYNEIGEISKEVNKIIS